MSIIAHLSAHNTHRAVGGEGIPESYLPKTCVHQWEGHTKVEPFRGFSLFILVIAYFRVSIAFDGYPSGVICYSAPLLTTLSRFGMCMTPSISLRMHLKNLLLVSYFLKALIDRVLHIIHSTFRYTHRKCVRTYNGHTQVQSRQLLCVILFSNSPSIVGSSVLS
jgi:hypothetical protein